MILALFARLFVFSFVCLAGSHSRLIIFFWFFCSILDSQSKKRDVAQYLKKFSGQEGLKSLKNAPNIRFPGFYLIYSYERFLLEDESTDGLLTFCKKNIWEKSGSWVVVQKPMSNENAEFFKLW